MGVLGVAPCCGVNGFVLGVVETVGDRPTGSSKEEKGTNPGTRKHKAKEELKGNQKQKYRPIDQNFKQTKKQHHPKRRDLASWVTAV